MLNYGLVHPTLLAALATVGHGDRILLADGNFPLRTAAHERATVVHLNVRPGLVSILQLLEPLLEALPVEGATFMGSPDGTEVAAHADYTRMLGRDVEIRIEGDRWKFYDETRCANVVIATGDDRLCSNLVLTVGVRGPSERAA